MVRRLLGGDGRDRRAEVPADHLGERAHGHAFVDDPVEHGARRSALERQRNRRAASSRVHRGPAVVTLADGARDAFLAREGLQALQAVTAGG